MRLSFRSLSDAMVLEIAAHCFMDLSTKSYSLD